MTDHKFEPGTKFTVRMGPYAGMKGVVVETRGVEPIPVYACSLRDSSSYEKRSFVYEDKMLVGVV
jgi:hypothetical protein